MDGFFAIIAAALTFFGFSPLFRHGAVRMAFLTLVAGFSFWYWIPAINLLTIGYIGLDNFIITNTVDSVCWWVFGFQFASLVILALIRPILVIPPPERATPVVPTVAIAWISFFSAMIFLFVRFYDEGLGVFFELANGLIGARERMSFANRSESVLQSMFAFWEIVTIWSSLFSLSWFVLTRKFLTIGGVAAATALTLMFVASGTRAILLQTVFLLTLATLFRVKDQVRISAKSLTRSVIAAALLVGAVLLVFAGFTARFSSDAGYAAAGPTAVIAGTLVVNNDMVREFSIALDGMTPSSDGVEDFILSPFTFMLPSFIGFQKDIPHHLVNYNQLRAGIDVNYGAGNVFPGLLADFWLVFGNLGPLAFALFIMFWTVVIDRLGRLTTDGSMRFAFSITAFSYIFFCFRNISGALALVIILGGFLLWLVVLYSGYMNNRISTGHV